MVIVSAETLAKSISVNMLGGLDRLRKRLEEVFIITKTYVFDTKCPENYYSSFSLEFLSERFFDPIQGSHSLKNFFY